MNIKIVYNLTNIMKTFCKCGCESPLTDYEYRKWSGYKRGHEPLP